MTNTILDVGRYLCGGCGNNNSMRFNFCPYCGTRNIYKPNNSQNVLRKPTKRLFFNEDRITEYLEKRNLSQFADKKYQIYIQLENGTTAIVPLVGRQNSNDALSYLRHKRLLSVDERYRIPDWPSADPCIGPDHIHISACVCELNPNRIYHVVRIKRNEFVLLYGCPNAKSVKAHNVLDQMKVEIMDYEN